jgi:CheY-like chemotaxis protein/two-component sensor histidine kinase
MFLATMSHEMRTPLHGVNAALELMDAESLSPEDRDLLRTALECSDRALEQVNNVLDITRLGERRDEGDTFGPAAIARTIIGELSPLARENRNRLGLEITGRGADALYMGAPDAFSRALYNLLGNALKFTRDGQVDLKLEFATAESGEGVLTVHVMDTGPGIAPEDHERIFREFETGRPGELFGPQGTGLGLSIVRIAVQHLGGTLTLDSAPGKGSRFSFEMPLRPAPAGHAGDQGHRAPDPVSQPAAAPVRALDVLVVDDSEVNLGLMCEMVRRLGHRTAMARNGREAVDAATAKAFDVILMDVSMPVMRGDEATRQIRKSGLSRGALIAAVTAACDTARRVELHEAGIDAVLVKPTKRADIADLLAIAAGGPAPAGHAPEGTGADRTHCTELLAQLEPMIGQNRARELMRAALDDIPAQMLEGEPLQDVPEELTEQLHKAAGSTAVVGLTALSGDLLTAERAAVAGDVAGLNAQRDRIAQQLRDCRKALALLESV